MAHASPSRPTVTDIRELFSQRSLWQTFLDVESVLAQTQAELGIIPAAAAAEIRRKANFEHVDEQALAADIAPDQGADRVAGEGAGSGLRRAMPAATCTGARPRRT